jgi:hypothetical protein
MQSLPPTKLLLSRTDRIREDPGLALKSRGLKFTVIRLASQRTDRPKQQNNNCLTTNKSSDSGSLQAF